MTTGVDLESENDDAQASIKEHAKYVPPQLRSLSRNELEEYSQIRKRVRGLLNRLSESNVEGITGDMSTIFQSIARSVGTEIINEEILASCAGGPRVAGLACLVGIDFGAKLLASLAKCFESAQATKAAKRIMKLDKDINKINSDALFVISNATELFIKFLAEKSSEVAIEKKRKTIKLEHMRIAVKRHQPTTDFLLDSLPMPPPAQTSSKPDRSHKSSGNNSVPVPAA
ncbi:hypothetical protein L2E82_14588 [Cichorium intybus]|uniref:Uncharacterized protein n=1 Tax=Cichorium intybus TaxID=13427 RepID=A0ACB9F1P4_CICIN|nr:hypothetical protein L2E82_14588 [Cichorium intybus]